MKRVILFLLSMFLLLLAQAQSANHYNALSWSWAQGTGDVSTGFHVFKSAVSGGPWGSPIATLTGTTLMAYNDQNVAPGQTNYYVVTAFATAAITISNPGGDSAYSNQITCVTPFQETPPTGLSGVAH